MKNPERKEDEEKWSDRELSKGKRRRDESNSHRCELSFFWFFSFRQLDEESSQLSVLSTEAGPDLQEHLNRHRLSIPWNNLKLRVDAELSRVLVDVSDDRLPVDDLEIERIMFSSCEG